jgi:uncharacterized NAD(P)/FAD-binding protein YdhS
MTNHPGRTVAVVGAGFCGTMVAVHLLRSSSPSVARVVLIERVAGRVGGVAYRTWSTSHTLNVPTGRMSPFEDDADHFLRFARMREPAVTGGSFVPRRLYGDYLADLLAAARTESATPLTRVVGEAVDVAPGGAASTVTLADGRRITADVVVLAIGNYPPSDPPAIGLDVTTTLRYARDPWAGDALEVDPHEPVLLVGTGLTMCDVALALRDADHRGPIVALSRRALLPQPHRVSAKPPPHLDRPATLDTWPDTAAGFLRALRGEVREAGARGIDWREVVTSIRHDTPALWQRLDDDERGRFLRHLRPYWETHRHRSSPETALAIESMIEEGSLAVVAATLAECRFEGDRVIATFVRRKTQALERLEVGKVINCSGPDTDLARVGDPLVASLRTRGLIRPDVHGLGLDSDEAGRVVDAAGAPSAWLSILGPLRKGRLWENTAVPELRVEAQRLAMRVGA